MDAHTAVSQAKPLTHKETRLIVWGVLLPLFMGSLDNTILATALPTIGRDFGDVQGLPWLITIYLLAATAAMPLYGKIADIRGRRFTLYIAIAIYLAGSLVCALAPSMLVLISGRALQGLGGAGLTSVAIIVLGDAAAPKDRGPYYAWFSVVYTTAGAIGPALGGSIADHLHWSVIFWLNIPLGLAAVWITSTVLRRLPRHERPHRLDLIGAILIVVASVAFMLGLNLGGRNYAWHSAPIILLFTVALVVGTGFVWRLLTAPEPLIPISILLDPIVRWAVLANSLGWASIVGLNIFLPMYLQSVIGLSPTNSGLSLMVLMMSLNATAGLAGQVLGRVQHYKILPMCLLVIAIGAVTMLALWAESLTIVWFEILVFLVGVGFGPVPSLCAVSMQNRVAQHQLGIAVGTMSFSRNLFTTIMVALLGTIVLAATNAIEPGASAQFGGAPPPGAAEAAQAFSRAFFVVAACLVAALAALVLMEEQPLRTGIVKDTKE
jgi:EmrB/QacA subfamily drug resistance transporter